MWPPPAPRPRSGAQRVGVSFDWQISEERPDDFTPPPGRRWPATIWLLPLLLLVLAALLVWRWRRGVADLHVALQEIVSVQSGALQAGDGDLFFSFLSADPAWQAAHLQPRVQALYRPAPTVVDVQRRGAQVRVTLRRSTDDGPLDQIAFFSVTDDGLRRVATEADFWGSTTAAGAGWGVLTLSAADEAWRAQIAAAVASSGYRGNVVIRGDYRQTAAAGQFAYPSPWLLGVGPDSNIDVYLATLTAALKAHTATEAIRFGVPLALAGRFRQLADAYTASGGPPIEIIALETLSIAPAIQLQVLDGQYLTPSAAQLATGALLDLSDFALTDPDFAAADFYPPLLDGGIWRDRLWLYPQSADFRLLFYDPPGLPDADIDSDPVWTWAQFDRRIPFIADLLGRNGILTAGLDPLFAYAYGAQTGAGALDSVAAAAALNWYADFPAVRDLSAETGDAARELAALRRLSSQRDVVAWFERPEQYEYHALLAPVQVRPYPAAEGETGVLPLTVNGSVISAYSAQPHAVWRWLHFVSRHDLDASRRAIPARRSLAQAAGYWDRLPPALRAPLVLGFANARAITIEDRRLIDWERVAAVRAGRQTALQAAQPTALRWFLVAPP